MRSGPYFTGPRGVYLNGWSLVFYQEKDVPSVFLVWVKLPYLPLHCWSDEELVFIGNSLACYIDNSKPKPLMFGCARNGIEVELEKEFLE